MHEFEDPTAHQVRPPGTFEKAIGSDMFAVPHSLYVDREGNVWAGDQIARNGKGADLIKFSPDGDVLMILGKPGMPGNGHNFLSAVSAVVGIRIGTRGGKVTAFIPQTLPEIGAPEGVGVDDEGNLYASWVAKMNVRRYVKK
jgi:hypothetical protein